MTRLVRLFAWAALLTLGLNTTASAQPERLRELGVPGSLAPWVDWVLHGKEDALCPDVGEGKLCAWPSLLELDLDASGGRFTQSVYTEAATDVPLVGASDRWPQDVTLDGKPAIVLEGPAVRVPAGRHELRGRFTWAALPESLRAPARVGQVTLRVDGALVRAPRRDPSGLLWLRQSQDTGDSTERLDVEVHRRIEDGVPARVITRLSLSVGGKTREVTLAGAQLPGTRAIELSGSLPARLEPDGTLRVQVAPGEHRIEVTSVSPTPPDALAAPKVEGPWGEREVWVFQADSSLREVEPTGAPRVDPARTTLAPDWMGLPTFTLTAGQKLELLTRRRGDAEPPPNELTLARDLWLDLDGDGYTVRDRIEGAMRRDWRLDLQEGELGRAAVMGQDQLVTMHEGERGIEVRHESLDLVAEWRLPRTGGALPAVGWSDDMHEVRTSLFLPPGWTLLGGEGPDRITGTLIDEWNLWSFFFVLLVALSTFKLAGPVWGAVALVALTLCTHQQDAPEGVWLWVLASLALARLSLSGIWGKAARVMLGVSALAAVLTLAPFTVRQLRYAMYPHVATESAMPEWMVPGAMAPPHVDEEGGMVLEELQQEDDSAAFGADMHPEAPMASKPMVSNPKGGGGSLMRGKAELADVFARDDADDAGDYGRTKSSWASANKLDEGAVVQTGPGVPDWSWERYQLVYDGPVQHDQTVQLWLLPPSLSRSLAVLRVLLAGLLLLGLLRASRGSLRPTSGKGAAAAAVGMALATCLGGLSFTSVAQAQTPSDSPDSALLEELQRRLLEAPECTPECVSPSKLEVQVRGAELTLRAEVHAGATVGYRAPGPLASFTPSEVRVDGKPAGALARLSDGFLLVRLDAGRHLVELTGPMPASDELTLQLGTPPHRVEVNAADFEVDGVTPEGTATGSIQLRRRVQTAGESLDTGAELPPWLTVQRQFDIGTRLRVITTVQRQGRSNAAVVLRFPLLKGESVTQSDVQETDGMALVKLAPGQSSVSFLTVLDPRESLTLKAPSADESQPYSVEWLLSCGTMYRCTAEGIAPVSHRTAGHYEPLYRPFPGETLAVKLDRLAPAEGQSATIDRAELRLEPGQRITHATLDLTVRTSSGSVLSVQFPKEAELASLTVGSQRTTQMKDGKLELSLEPGTQQVVTEVRLPSGLDTRYVTPAVKVGDALVNVRVHVSMPPDRWLLWTGGPDWGPAVLFWGMLLAYVLFAVVLARLPGSPLRAYQWVLLALGLTQVPIAASALVIGWFFVVNVRKTRAPKAAWAFNLFQLGLVLLTFIAAGTLVEAVHQGLVVRPDMQVAGGGSNDYALRWYVDRTGGSIPQASVLSVPLWIYRGLMLAWALWLSVQALRWLRLGWDAFSEGGRWKRLPRKMLGYSPRAAAAPAAPTASPEPAPQAAPPPDDEEPSNET